VHTLCTHLEVNRFCSLESRPIFVTAVISYIVYGLAVSILGASSGAAFAASCPAMTALMAIPILGEWPSAIDWIAITLISIGVYVISGGPLPRRQAKMYGRGKMRPNKAPWRYHRK
jgi:multidrug transporter EmrE-like cation transporter